MIYIPCENIKIPLKSHLAYTSNRPQLNRISRQLGICIVNRTKNFSKNKWEWKHKIKMLMRNETSALLRSAIIRYSFN